MFATGAEHSLFKSKSIVMRLHYRHYADEGFFHTFKAPGTRLFNNLVIPVKTADEAKGSSCCEMITSLDIFVFRLSRTFSFRFL